MTILNARVALKQTQTTTTTQQSWRFTKEICNYCVKLQISITCPTIEAFINNNIIDCSSTKWATITAYNTTTNNRTQKQTTVEELKSATTPAASTATAKIGAPQYKRQVHLAGLAWQGLQHIFTPQSNSDNKIQKSLNNIKLTLQKEVNVYNKNTYMIFMFNQQPTNIGYWVFAMQSSVDDTVL